MALNSSIEINQFEPCFFFKKKSTTNTTTTESLSPSSNVQLGIRALRPPPSTSKTSVIDFLDKSKRQIFDDWVADRNVSQRKLVKPSDQPRKSHRKNASLIKLCLTQKKIINLFQTFMEKNRAPIGSSAKGRFRIF
jgi:hypothetical protein